MQSYSPDKDLHEEIKNLHSLIIFHNVFLEFKNYLGQLHEKFLEHEKTTKRYERED